MMIMEMIDTPDRRRHTNGKAFVSNQKENKKKTKKNRRNEKYKKWYSTSVSVGLEAFVRCG